MGAYPSPQASYRAFSTFFERTEAAPRISVRAGAKRPSRVVRGKEPFSISESLQTFLRLFVRRTRASGCLGVLSQLMRSRVFYSGSPELKYLYDLITLLFTHCVVFRIPPPEPNDRSRMRREESADSKRVFCCSRKTNRTLFLILTSSNCSEEELEMKGWERTGPTSFFNALRIEIQFFEAPGRLWTTTQGLWTTK